MAEDGFGAQDEFVAVACFAQGVGADDAHGALGHAVDQLREALEAFEAPLHGFFAQLTLFTDAGGQLHFSPSRSRMRISLWWALATTMWKLLEPRSMAAIRDRFFAVVCGMISMFSVDNPPILP